MATLAQIQQFFRVLLTVHWEKVGIERVTAMREKVEIVAEQLFDYVANDAKFFLTHRRQLTRGVCYNPLAWRVSPFRSNDKPFHDLALMFLAELQVEFTREHAAKYGLQQLIEDPKLASYVLTQFFLNNGSQLLDVDPKTIQCWRTIDLMSGKDMLNTSWLPALNLGYNAGRLLPTELYEPFSDDRVVPVSLQLAKVSLADIGFADFATRQDAENRVRDLGFFPCPFHLGPQLRHEYQDQPDGETLTLLQDSLDPLWAGPESKKRFLAFSLLHYEAMQLSEHCLETHDAYPNITLYANTRLVICLNDPLPKEEDLGMVGNHECFLEQRVATVRQG